MGIIIYIIVYNTVIWLVVELNHILFVTLIALRHCCVGWIRFLCFVKVIFWINQTSSYPLFKMFVCLACFLHLCESAFNTASATVHVASTSTAINTSSASFSFSISLPMSPSLPLQWSFTRAHPKALSRIMPYSEAGWLFLSTYKWLQSILWDCKLFALSWAMPYQVISGCALSVLHGTLDTVTLTMFNAISILVLLFTFHCFCHLISTGSAIFFLLRLPSSYHCLRRREHISCCKYLLLVNRKKKERMKRPEKRRGRDKK